MFEIETAYVGTKF